MSQSPSRACYHPGNTARADAPRRTRGGRPRSWCRPCAPWPASTRRPTPRADRSCTVLTKWARFRPQPVELPDDEHVALPQGTQAAVETMPAACRCVALQVQRLGAVGLREAGVADQHVSQTTRLRHESADPAGAALVPPRSRPPFVSGCSTRTPSPVRSTDARVHAGEPKPGRPTQPPHRLWPVGLNPLPRLPWPPRRRVERPSLARLEDGWWRTHGPPLASGSTRTHRTAGGRRATGAVPSALVRLALRSARRASLRRPPRLAHPGGAPAPGVARRPARRRCGSSRQRTCPRAVVPFLTTHEGHWLARTAAPQFTPLLRRTCRDRVRTPSLLPSARSHVPLPTLRATLSSDWVRFLFGR